MRTAFNLLGPLTNPAGTRRQLLGVGDVRAAGRFAEVVHRLGTERTLVVHGAGVDELPLDGTGVLYEVTEGGVEQRFVDAEALGLRPAATSKLAGGDAATNARYVEAVLRGEPGARRDVVLLNAAAAFMAAGSVDSLEDGLERAALTIDAGLTAELLGRLRAERIAAETAAAEQAAAPGHRGPGRFGRRAGGAIERGRQGMTVATPRATRPANVVAEIAARRREDLAPVLGSVPTDADLAAAPPARPIVERLAAPGLHLIAEIKRASPSAGRIAGSGEDIVARARAYEAGGAAAISVLCEPHWFGGSLDDLRAVRAAVAIPVLAKEFVVDARQLPMLREAGADVVLLLAVLHPRASLGRLVERALSLGLEPLVEVHDERELRSALETDARLIGLNNRDLRTLDVDTSRADRLRALVPDDRLVDRRVWRARCRDRRPLARARVRCGARRRGAHARARRRSRRLGRSWRRAASRRIRPTSPGARS